MENLLAKYVRNECSPQEEKLVIDYLQNPTNGPKLQPQMWIHWQQVPIVIDEAPDWQQLWRSIENQTELKRGKIKKPANPNFRLVKVTIWICLILGLGFSIQYLQNWYIPMALVYHTQPDERLKIVLPGSSSTVVLNGNSTLRCFPKNTWSNGKVWLQGEGYFTVNAREETNPLSVHASSKLSLEVDKGSFYLSNRDSLTRLVVGQEPLSVVIQPSLFGTASVQFLQEGEIVEFDKDKGAFSSLGIESPEYLDWMIPYLN